MLNYIAPNRLAPISQRDFAIFGGYRCERSKGRRPEVNQSRFGFGGVESAGT